VRRDHPRLARRFPRSCIPMSAHRLEPGKGKSPRVVVPLADSQRHALAAHSATTGLSTAQLVRDAVAAWLAEHPLEEVGKAS